MPDWKQELVTLLDSLTYLDRFAGCSDLFFRQVLTQKIKALQASGYIEMLRADAAKPTTSKAKRKDEEK